VPYVIGENYQLEITAQGNTLEVYIDSFLIFSVTDGSLTSGTIALYCWGNEGSYFDDILVEDLSGGNNQAPVILSVTVTPSTIYDDEACDLEVVANDPDSGPSPLSYHWIVQPGEGILDDPYIPNPVYTPPDVSSTQTFTLTVQVSDGEDTVPSNVNVTVTDVSGSDVITVVKAEYKVSEGELRVEAVSSQPEAELTVEGYGVMTWNSEKNQYEYREKAVTDPSGSVTITSSLGGSVTASVTYIGSGDPDVITIKKAEYKVSEGELLVEAFSSGQPAAELTVEGYGVMTWNSEKNQYEYREKAVADPGGPVTITSSLGGSVTASVTYIDVGNADVITVKKAEYKVSEGELRVEAFSSSQPDAELTVEGYGVMTWNSEKNKYEYREKAVTDPGGSVTITSSLGGSVTASIAYKDVSGANGIAIKKSEYKVDKGELLIEAVSSNQPAAELTVEGHGVMTWNSGKDKYEYRKKAVADPGNSVTITSSLGGSVTTSVAYRYEYVTDMITIKEAEYKAEKGELLVEAMCRNQPTAVLTVEGYGTMTFNSKKYKYEFREKGVAEPGGSVTVTSSLGGSVTVQITFD
jgi:ABC-type sulfate transport system substrate-binding protein